MTAVGVVGRYELGPMSDALRASRLGWYPLVALSALGGADALFAGGIVASGDQLSTSLGIPNLSLLLYVRLAALVLGGAVVLYLHSLRRSQAVRAAAVLLPAGLVAMAVVRTPWALVGVTALTCLGSGVAWALHRVLLFDHYRPEVRVRALCIYASGVMVGWAAAAALLPLLADVGLTWRVEFLLLAAVAGGAAAIGARLSDGPVPTWEERIVAAQVGTTPPDPGVDVPGAQGADGLAPERPLRVAQSFRMVMSGPSAAPLLVAASGLGLAIITLPSYLARFWRDHWGLGNGASNGLYAALALVSVAALAWFGRRGELAFRADPARMLRMAARLAGVGAVVVPLACVVRPFGLMVVAWAVVMAGLVVLNTSAAVALLAAVRPAVRPHASLSLGVAVLSGALTGNFLLAGITSRFGERWAFIVLALFVGAAAASASRAARTASADVGDSVDALFEAAELRVRLSRGHGVPLLAVSHVDFAYGPVQVLFDVSFSVAEGEMVALLGTNGAGKSTLLRLISGISVPTRGSIRLRGRDVTYVGPDERVRLGIGQVPGGRAVFGPLTVAENLRVFGYTHGRDRRAVEAGIEAGLAAFPSLARHVDDLAAGLSGGEQQMLGLAKAFVVPPQVLLIDELSLGLAPVVVGDLLETVRRLNAAGTAVVVVEQSVNVALTLVDHAYFMEKGEIRFDGPAADLARRPDLLRSVFLEGAAAGGADRGARRRRRAAAAP